VVRRNPDLRSVVIEVWFQVVYPKVLALRPGVLGGAWAAKLAARDGPSTAMLLSCESLGGLQVSMRAIYSIEGVRYVGDRATFFVHDSWNRESEACFLDSLAEEGRAVAFDPDTLEQAFNEGFDYCDVCVGKEEPPAPEAEARKRAGAKADR